MDNFLSKEHEILVVEHFQELESKLKKLEHEAQETDIPSDVSGMSKL